MQVMHAIRIIHLSERRPHVLTVTLRKLRCASNCFSLLNQYVADSYVSDDTGENYACNTLAFKMTRFLCVPQRLHALVDALTPEGVVKLFLAFLFLFPHPALRPTGASALGSCAGHSR
jgi:hypothetical protein